MFLILTTDSTDFPDSIYKKLATEATERFRNYRTTDFATETAEDADSESRYEWRATNHELGGTCLIFYSRSSLRQLEAELFQC